MRHSKSPWEQFLFLALPTALRSMTTGFEGTKQNHEILPFCSTGFRLVLMTASGVATRHVITMSESLVKMLKT